MKHLFSIYSPFFLGIVLIAYCGSRPGTEIEPKDNCNQLQPGQTGFVQLVNKNEPGEPLIIYGRVVDHKTNRPVHGVNMFLYQTDNKGIYNAANSSAREEQARIKGNVTTASTGCFKIKTILPGDYPGQKNSRHLHYVINAKGYKEVRSTLFFKGFTTASGNSALTILDIRKDSMDTWVGSTNFFMEEAK